MMIFVEFSFFRFSVQLLLLDRNKKKNGFERSQQFFALFKIQQNPRKNVKTQLTADAET